MNVMGEGCYTVGVCIPRTAPICLRFLARLETIAMSSSELFDRQMPKLLNRSRYPAVVLPT